MNGAAALTRENHNTAQFPDDELLWKAVLDRDGRFDGRVFFGVRSTGIYCRPSCPARRPHREQVVFFQIPEAAESAGFRSCLRCHPRTADSRDPQVEMVRRACRYIEAHFEEPPTLDALSVHTGVSTYHLQRVFKRIAGVSPRQYGEAFRLSKFKGAVKRGDFKYGESPNVPGWVSIPNRAYMNLLEMPVLFYVICLLLFLLGTASILARPEWFR